MTAPALFGLDWGTSSLRAFLFGAYGAVLDRRSAPLGLMQIGAGGFPAAFAEIAGAWLRDWPDLPAIASGMVGSAQGWAEAPYCVGETGADALAERLVAVPTGLGAGRLHIVPGVALGGPCPDVMRGEETQIAGALALHPELAGESCFVLPGTHCKWVEVRGGRIGRFRTFMTGELFDVLRRHSILGRPAAGAPAAVPDEAAFLRGVAAARASGEGIAPLLFSARTLVLRGGLPAASSLDYLSGLLIGDEIRAATSAAAPGGSRLAMIGAEVLCRRYRTALSAFGSGGAIEVEGATEAGLWEIASRAGLVRAAA